MAPRGSSRSIKVLHARSWLLYMKVHTSLGICFRSDSEPIICYTTITTPPTKANILMTAASKIVLAYQRLSLGANCMRAGVWAVGSGQI